MKCPKCRKWIAPEATTHAECGWKSSAGGGGDGGEYGDKGGYLAGDGAWFQPCAAYGCPLRGTFTREIYGDARDLKWWCFVHSAGEAYSPQEITQRVRKHAWLFALLEFVRTTEFTAHTLERLNDRLTAMDAEDLRIESMATFNRRNYERQVRGKIVRTCLEGLQSIGEAVEEKRRADSWASLDNAMQSAGL